MSTTLWAPFESAWHDSMHCGDPREVINLAHCVLCGGECLPDAASRDLGVAYCGRMLCVTVRQLWAKQPDTNPHRTVLEIPQ